MLIHYLALFFGVIDLTFLELDKLGRCLIVHQLKLRVNLREMSKTRGLHGCKLLTVTSDIIFEGASFSIKLALLDVLASCNIFAIKSQIVWLLREEITLISLGAINLDIAVINWRFAPTGAFAFAAIRQRRRTFYLFFDVIRAISPFRVRRLWFRFSRKCLKQHASYVLLRLTWYLVL